MKKKIFGIPLLSLLMISLLGGLVIAVSIINPLWSDGSTTMTIAKGASASFTVALTSANPSISYNIGLYDANDNFVSTVATGSAGSHANEIWVTVTSADYNGLGGTYGLWMVANDQYLSDGPTKILNLVVTQSAPVVSALPNVQMEQDTSTQAFDLDAYVTDADDALADITWSVTGNNDVIVAIDANNIVTLTPSAGFVGQNTLTFTATDPSGDTGSSNVVVDVVATGTLDDVDKSVTIYRLEIESFEGDYLKIRNTGSSIDDVSMQLTVEGADVDVQRFRFDLDRNRVVYKVLDLEGLEAGTYLARVSLDSLDDEDFDKTGYLLIERF